MALRLDAFELLAITCSMCQEAGEDGVHFEEVDSRVLEVGKEFLSIGMDYLCTWLSREGLEVRPEDPQVDLALAQPPTAWAGGTRQVDLRLLLPRGELGLSFLSPAFS